MWAQIKDKSIAFHRSFHGSLVILFARLQFFIGAIWTVLIMTDLSPLIGNPKYLTLWLIFSGLVTEMGRRQGTYVDQDNKLAPRKEETINVSVNNTETAPPAAPIPSPVPVK